LIWSANLRAEDHTAHPQPRDIGLLLRQLAEPYRTMVLVAACLGLRVSEIIGLQWGDFNWDDLTLLVKRSVVQGRVGDTKTEASHLPLPVDPRLARIMDMLLDSKFDLSHSLQGLVPATFQFVRYQAVFWIRRIILFLGATRRILSRS
jgi:integrase